MYTHLTNTEIHILIDWGKTIPIKDVISKIRENPQLQFLKHLEHPSIPFTHIVDMYEDTKTKTPEKYNHYKKDGELLRKGKEPFNIYYVKDNNPRYELIKGISYKHRNVNLTYMKKYIRKFYKLGYGIHVTDCLSESEKHRHILQIE